METRSLIFWLLPDVMTIADEVDSQLTQAMEGFTSIVGTAVAT
ncbi:MAG: hypothetical protein WBV55_23265 [Candidatus Sulfotelmatobacter sp.]